jgi:hypothetical protein
LPVKPPQTEHSAHGNARSHVVVIPGAVFAPTRRGAGES